MSHKCIPLTKSVGYELLASGQKDAQQSWDRRAKNVICWDCQCLTGPRQLFLSVTPAFSDKQRSSPLCVAAGSNTGQFLPELLLKKKKESKLL